MRVIPVPCLSDNYAYLVTADGSDMAFVVDPSESAPVIAALTQHRLRLVAILNTHHHHDHIGGNEGLLAEYGPMPVYAHAIDKERIPALTVPLVDGQEFSVAGLDLRAIHVPGHTRGAVAYVVEGAVFTGDTLFVGGCGRLFEGTAEQMYESLNVKLARLPRETKIYCGHEYTVNNLRFAVSVEPGNGLAAVKLAAAQAIRARGEPTVPSTLDEELATNPFLRCEETAFLARYPAFKPAQTFAQVRKAKDEFQ